MGARTSAWVLETSPSGARIGEWQRARTPTPFFPASRGPALPGAGSRWGGTTTPSSAGLSTPAGAVEHSRLGSRICSAAQAA